MTRVTWRSPGRRLRMKLLASMLVVVAACLFPTDRVWASPEGDEPDFSNCDEFEGGDARGECIWEEDPNCAYAEGEDLELCKAWACRDRILLSNLECREEVERRGEELGPGQRVECEEPPYWIEEFFPEGSDARESWGRFLETYGMKDPYARVVVPDLPTSGGHVAELRRYHDEWEEEVVRRGQCYLANHYPRVCDPRDEDGDSPEAEGYEQAQGFVPDPCVSSFRSSQYDINHRGTADDRFFGFLANTGFGIGKGALQLAFMATDYATGFDMIDKLGEPVREISSAYETHIVGPFGLNDFAWLALTSYVALLVVVGKLRVAGIEFGVSLLMLALFTALMQAPGGPQAFMRGAQDTIDQTSVAALRAGCDDDDARTCSRNVLRGIQGDLHQLFVHEPYLYVNWNWSPRFEEECGSRARFIIATGSHGTADWVRTYMRRGRASGGPCAVAAEWNAEMTGERMVQAVVSGVIAFAVAVVLAAMALTVILAKLVIALLFMLAPFANAVAVLPGQGRRLAVSWVTTVLQGIILAVSMAFLLVVMMRMLRVLARIPTGANLTLYERWFLVLAAIVLVWYARKRVLAAARGLAAGVTNRLAAPAASGGGGGGGGFAPMVDPHAGSIFGSTRMRANEAYALTMQSITAAATTTAVVTRPFAAAGRTVVARYGRRDSARRALRNLEIMERYKERRDGIHSERFTHSMEPHT
jgi:hypothetical protein